MAKTQTPGRAQVARDMTDGQRAYEAKRAAKAGLSLDKWLAQKEREAEAAARNEARAARDSAKAAKKPGLFARLIERAHKPLPEKKK